MRLAELFSWTIVDKAGMRKTFPAFLSLRHQCRERETNTPTVLLLPKLKPRDGRRFLGNLSRTCFYLVQTAQAVPIQAGRQGISSLAPTPWGVWALFNEKSEHIRTVYTL